MQGMMRMMHQRAQSEQRQPAHLRLPNDPPNRWGRCGDAPNPDCARRRAMMQMMQGMMQIMQSLDVVTGTTQTTIAALHVR